MIISPRELLDTSIAQLRTLAAFMSEQLAEGSDEPEVVTTETRACSEILCFLRALILRFETPDPVAEEARPEMGSERPLRRNALAMRQAAADGTWNISSAQTSERVHECV